MRTRIIVAAAAFLLSGRALQADAQDANAAHAFSLFPETIALPNGFQPEGVTVHKLDVLAGSLLDGDIYEASIVTGKGRVVVDAPEGRMALGLKADARNRLFVAGGVTGQAYVYDLATGASLAEYTLGPAQTSIINDVILTPNAAYFTDSFSPVLYRLPLGPRGALPDAAAVETLTVTGPAADDFVAGDFNFNGIEFAGAEFARAARGSLIVVNSARGALYRIDPRSGASTRIDLGGEDVASGDGIVLRGRTLYVVQNQLNAIAVVQLQRGLESGEVVDVITDPRFQIPTTADAIGPFLFAVNARFDVAPPPVFGTLPSDPSIEFDIIRVRR